MTGGSQPGYISAANPTTNKVVNLGGANTGKVNFVNSLGIASGYFADASGRKHACIWKSLSQPPTDLTNVASGITLQSIDFAFDSGVLLGSDANGAQYKMTPQ